MYFVEPSQWIRVATMRMTGAASRWLQPLDPKVKKVSWEEFCQMVLDRFGKHQYELVLSDGPRSFW